MRDQEDFLSWLKQNCFNRDATAQVKEMFRGKTIQEIAKSGYWILEEPYDEDDLRRLNFWKDSYDQVTFWYQLEYFFEQSIEELEDDWAVGELFVSIEWQRPLGHDDYETEESLCWGIKSDMHLNLKLKEWADCWSRGAMINQAVYDGIPQEFGGDIGR